MLKKLESDKDFNNTISNGLWLVDFKATWCGPCKMLEPVLDELSSKYNILSVDIDKCSNITNQMGIMSVPTLILFKDGKQEKMTVGYHNTEEVEEFITK